MCNRYIAPSAEEIARHWQTPDDIDWGESEIFPRRPGAFIRPRAGNDRPDLVIGQWGLIPWFTKALPLKFSTNNARFEEIAAKASFKSAWSKAQRCIIPASTFDEPCWESGRNVWWRFRRKDGAPWGLAGLWSTWVDKGSGESVESYTMLTINADDHPLMSRMHKPDPRLGPDQQDKRSVVAIEQDDVARWLYGTAEEASGLVRAPGMGVSEGGPMTASK